MPTLYITRGLPGSGKSTWATGWVAADPETRVRVNRDELRRMLHDSTHIKGVTEPRVLAVRDEAITAMLRKGVDVACDDANLPSRVMRDLMLLARRARAAVEVVDLTGVPLQTCITRDAARPDPVGEKVIRDLWGRYLDGKPSPLPLPELTAAPDVAPYMPLPGTPATILVDIDGTLALIGDRNPYDETRVGEDQPNGPVIAAVQALWRDGNRIVFVSGRSERCREATEQWLRRHLPGIASHSPLFMRTAGDVRRDAVVKAEIFDRHIRDHHDVVFVLDDRRQVVDAWRAMGLTVFQVAEGNF